MNARVHLSSYINHAQYYELVIGADNNTMTKVSAMSALWLIEFNTNAIAYIYSAEVLDKQSKAVTYVYTKTNPSLTTVCSEPVTTVG